MDEEMKQSRRARGDFEWRIIKDPEANGFVRGSENVAVDFSETGNESEIDQGLTGRYIGCKKSPDPPGLFHWILNHFLK
jgi:hypothetical protein